MAGQRRKGQDELVFVPLGGVGEIGMNLYLYGFGPREGRKWIMVDLGVTFASEQEPGADVILPDTRFIEENKADLLGIVLTHGHEDHIGAVVDLWPRLKAPIFATPFTAGLLNAKIGEDRPGAKLPITVVPNGGSIELGPFKIEYVGVAHSIPESHALAIRTPLGLVVHTADWKIDEAPLTGDPTDEKRFREFGKEGVLALVCDSTNALREGQSPSEEAVGRALAEVIAKADARVAVTLFASNVARVRSVAEAARVNGREVVVAGRALHRVIQVAQETGHLSPHFHFHDQTAFSSFGAREVLAICTGSQGEARAALARIAAGEHPEVELQRGDMVVFSSRTIPGNEKAVGRIMNSLADLGVRIVTDADHPVHVTGHPRRGELRQMFDWVKPQVLIPMHGEARHLEEHAALGEAQGIKTVVRARNGSLVRLAPGPAEIVADVPVGRIIRDGNVLVSGENDPVRERRRLSYTGICVVSVVIERSGEIAADPEVMLDGIPEKSADGSSMEDLVYDAVDGALESIPLKRRRDPALVEEAATRAARSALSQAWGKKPICKVLVSVV